MAGANGNGKAPAQSIGFAALIQFQLELLRGEFHGQLVIQFRGGRIGMVKREETWVEGSQLPVADLEAVRMMETGRTFAAT